MTMSKKTKITKTKNAKAIAKTMSIQANNETEEIVIHTPFFDKPMAKPKYSLNDLKTKKIAVHLPTQSDLDKYFELLDKNSVDLRGLKGWKPKPYKKQYGYIYRSESTYKNHLIENKKQGYTIITLDQLMIDCDYKTVITDRSLYNKEEGLEPTAEDKNDYSILEQCDGELDSVEEKLKYITQSFDGTGYLINNGEDSIQITSENFQSIKEFLEGKEKVITRDDFNGDLGFAEGSRAWALLALDRGEKITNKDWDRGEYIRLDRTGYVHDESGDQVTAYFLKDGWEIYKETKEEPETMTLRELTLSRKDCRFKLATNTNSIYEIKGGKVVEISWDKDKYPQDHWSKSPIIDMFYLTANLDTKVEIIKEQNGS